MRLPDDRHRAPFLGLPVFETFALIFLLIMFVMPSIGPILRWLFR